MAQYLNLDLAAIKNKSGAVDESSVTIEEESALFVFGRNGERLPSHAIKGFASLEKIFDEATKTTRP
jgi:hypothetical protein